MVDREASCPAATLTGMWIRLLLQPWWLRTVCYAAAVLVTVCAFLVGLRWQGGAISVPLLGWLLIAVGAVVVAGLLAVAVGQGREQYVQALGAAHTPDQRSQAITAVWRGPAPADPDVRRAAERLARVQLDAYGKNRRTLIWAYLLVALSQVAQIGLAFGGDQPRKALLPAVLIAVLIWGGLHGRASHRRLRARIAVLNEPGLPPLKEHT